MFWMLIPKQPGCGNAPKTLTSEHGLTLYLFSSRNKADEYLNAHNAASVWQIVEIGHDDLSVRGGFGGVWINQSGNEPDGKLLSFTDFVMQMG